MSFQSKVQVLNFIAIAFSWVWLIANALAIYFIVSALFFDGGWTRFFVAIGVGVLAKWLYRGFEENKRRIAYEGILEQHGLPQDEARKAWDVVQAGGPDRLRELRQSKDRE